MAETVEVPDQGRLEANGWECLGDCEKIQRLDSDVVPDGCTNCGGAVQPLVIYPER